MVLWLHVTSSWLLIRTLLYSEIEGGWKLDIMLDRVASEASASV